jgi:hypothetical protein
MSIRAAFITDSIGLGHSGDTPYPYLLAPYFGWGEVVVDAIGSTGYLVAPGGQQPFSAELRH